MEMPFKTVVCIYQLDKPAFSLSLTIILFSLLWSIGIRSNRRPSLLIVFLTFGNSQSYPFGNMRLYMYFMNILTGPRYSDTEILKKQYDRVLSIIIIQHIITCTCRFRILYAICIQKYRW